MDRQLDRRALCIGISTFGSAGGEPATDSFGDLPYAVERAKEVRDALARLNYCCTSAGAGDLTTADDLGVAVKGRLVSGSADVVDVVHVLTHGMSTTSGLYLLGADGKHSPETDVAHWIATLEDFDNRSTTLFLLDACHAGGAARLSWLAAAGEETKAWVIAATTKHSPAYDGVFSTAVARVLTEIADGTLDLYPSTYVPFGVLVEQIRRRVAEIGVREQFVTSTPVDGAPEPPFVPNPCRPTDAAFSDAVSGSDESLRPFLDLDPSLDAAHFMDRAAGRALNQGTRQGYFTGRGKLLRELSGWLEQGGSPLRVVTGGPGSGKSAVLGIVVCAAHRNLRAAAGRLLDPVSEDDLPSVLDHFAAVHLRERDLRSAVDGVRRQLGLHDIEDLDDDADYADALIAAVETLPTPPVIVMDALDESIGQQAILKRLLLPLSSAIRPDLQPACKLLVGTRPWEEFGRLLRLARAQNGLTDLDAIPAGVLKGELTDYVKDLLGMRGGFTVGERRKLAEGVATVLTTRDRQRGGEFLAAALYSNLLLDEDPVRLRSRGLAQLIAAVPTSVPALFDLDLSRSRIGELDAVDRWVRPVLAVIAYGHGSGVPATVIRRLAPVFIEDDEHNQTPEALSVEGLRAVMARVRFYLRSAPGSDGITVYRFFHQSLVDHLRPPEGKLSNLFDGLVQLARLGMDGSRSWHTVEPYVQEHWLEHAIDAGRLEETLHADACLLRAVCNTRQRPYGRLTAAIWHNTDQSGTADLRDHHGLLGLNAVRYGAADIAARLAVGDDTDPRWWPTWSTGSQLTSPALLSTMIWHTGEVTAVACTSIDGQAVAVTGGRDGTMRIWDLTNRMPLGEPLTGFASNISALGCTVLDGRPVAVSGDFEGTVRIWDLADRTQIGQPLTGHRGTVFAVACTVVDGRPVAVTGGFDETVRIWDLTNPEQSGQPLTGHVNEVYAVGCAVVDGRSIAVTGGFDKTVRIWDLADRAQNGQHLSGHDSDVTFAACTVADDRPIAVTGDNDGTLRIWDLIDRDQTGRPLNGHRGKVYAAGCAVVDGRSVVVTGGDDGTVRIWDLADRAQIGQPLAGHSGWVRSVACTTVDDQPVAVTSGDDGTVRIWDLADRAQIGQPLAGHSGWVRSVACTTVDDQPVAVTGADDGTVRIWDLYTGRQIGEPLAGHDLWASTAACTLIEGRPAAVTGGDDGTVRFWDLSSRKQIGKPLFGHASEVSSVTCTSIGGHPTAITNSNDGSVWIWYLDGRKVLSKPLIGHGHGQGHGNPPKGANAVACTLLGERPIAVTGGRDKTVRVWDLDTRKQIGKPLIGHGGAVTTVACTSITGRPVAVTSGRDGSVRIWDLIDQVQIGQPLTGQSDDVSVVGCASFGGRPVAVTSGRDRTVRIWDLVSRGEIFRLMLPEQAGAVAITDDDSLIIGYGHEVARFDRRHDMENS